MKNTSQDDEYVGPLGHEKKMHKTHFGVVRSLKNKKRKHPKDNPEWEYIGPGRWKWVGKKRSS